MKIFYAALVSAMLFFACAPVRLVKPLEKGEKVIGANLGGPLINFAGAPIPIPYTSAFMAKGVSEKTSVFGGVHLTALAFGVAQIELGACRQIWVNPEKNIGFSINPALHVAVDKWEWNARFWPQLDAQFYKTFQNKSYFYAGVGNWFEPTRVRPHNETQEQFWFMYPQLGYRWGKSKWNYGLETKWVGPNIKNQPNVADYIGINHHGAVGLYFTLMRRF